MVSVKMETDPISCSIKIGRDEKIFVGNNNVMNAEVEKDQSRGGSE